MFLLDTNVVSELQRMSPEPVETWVGDRQVTNLYFSVIGEAELCYGVATRPTGWCQTVLASVIEVSLREDFEGRVLHFDSVAVCAYADITVLCRSTGRSVALVDCQIAEVDCSRNIAVATCNVRGFEGIDIGVVAPWMAA